MNSSEFETPKQFGTIDHSVGRQVGLPVEKGREQYGEYPVDRREHIKFISDRLPDPDSELLFESAQDEFIADLSEVLSDLRATEILEISNQLKEPYFSSLGEPEKYAKVVSAAEKLVTIWDEKKVVRYIKAKYIHPTVLERLVAVWSGKNLRQHTEDFNKLVRIMVDSGILNYDLQEAPMWDLGEKNFREAHLVGLLRQIEHLLENSNPSDLVVDIKRGYLHPAVITALRNAIEQGSVSIPQSLEMQLQEIARGMAVYSVYFDLEDNIKTLTIEDMKDSFDFDTLSSLLNLYNNEGRIDPGGCKEKIENALKLI